MHQPSVELRQASYHGHTEFISAAKRLLGIGGITKPHGMVDYTAYTVTEDVE